MTGRVLGTVLAFGLAWLIGHSLVACLWRDRSGDLADRLLRLAAAVGLGSGLVALLTFLWIAVFGKISRSIVVMDLTVVVMLSLAQARTRMRRSPTDGMPRFFGWVSGGVFLLFMVVALGIVGTLLLRVPNGACDGMAIWNTHAKFLISSPVNAWKAMFDPVMEFSRPDYPFLTPAFIARGWLYAGHSIPLVPLTTAFSFAFALLVLVTAAVGKARGPILGCLACAVLAASPIFLGNAASQYADLPLAFYFMLSIALLHRADQHPESHRGLHVLAGLSAGMAAITKNEGLLLLVALVVGRILYLLLVGKTRAEMKNLAGFLLGAAPALLVLALYKSFAPANYLISGQGKDFWSKLFDGSRAKLIIDQFLMELEKPNSFAMLYVQRTKTWHWHLLAATLFILLFGLDHRRLARRASSWGLVLVLIGVLSDILGTRLASQAFGWHWPVVVGAVLSIVALGFDLERLKRPSFLAATATLVAVNAGYFVVYLLTPLDLKWQLTFSVERLVLHTMPVAIFIAFLAVAPWGREPILDTTPSHSPEVETIALNGGATIEVGQVSQRPEQLEIPSRYQHQ